MTGGGRQKGSSQSSNTRRDEWRRWNRYFICAKNDEQLSENRNGNAYLCKGKLQAKDEDQVWKKTRRNGKVALVVNGRIRKNERQDCQWSLKARSKDCKWSDKLEPEDC